MGDQNKRVFRAKTAGRELLETNPLDFTVVQLLWNSQVIRAGESLTVGNAARFARGLTERHALWAKLSSKKRQTKPIEISHKPLAIKELISIHSDLLVQNEPNSGSLQDGRSEGYTTIGSRYADEPGRLWIGWPRMTRNGTERPGNCVPERGMVQKQVTAQGWLGSRPEGQRPQIRGLRAGGSLAVASSI